MRLKLLGIAGAVLVIGAAVAVFNQRPQTTPAYQNGVKDPVSEPVPSTPPLAAQDASTDVSNLKISQTDAILPSGFAGTGVCADCHPGQYKSYLTTHHSRSLQVPSPTDPTSVGNFMHPLSHRSYNAAYKNEVLVHREFRYFSSLLSRPVEPATFSETDPRMPVAEFPVAHVMGSGAFAKGYLLSDKDFLMESPLTWYTKPKAFGMAPGYDAPSHFGMTRVISEDCLFCHAGISSRRDENDEHTMIHEMAIGCERCHGPGQEHSNKLRNRVDLPLASGALPTSSALEDSGEDLKIVHPGKLSRSLSESICAQCHLQGDVVVPAQNRSVWDFVPGERFDETRVNYRIDSPTGKEKTFVDHFDQMWQSKCYQKSDSLTCITCHNPHHDEVKSSSEEFQQANCLKCHTDESCGVELTQRHLKMENRCIRCHMPKSASEVPHAATTNHLIGIPESATPPPSNRDVYVLRRLYSPLDDAAKSTTARTELLATANWALDNDKNKNIPVTVREKSLPDLIQLSSSQKEDSRVLATIAGLAKQTAESLPEGDGNTREIETQWKTAGQYALRALDIESNPSMVRKLALEVIAAKQFNEGDFQGSLRSYRELTKIRRSSIDWYNLGLCYGRLKLFADAERSFQESIRLDATYTAPYRSLAILYSSLNPPLAERMRKIDMLLQSP